MKNRTTRFLIVSFSVLIILCTFIFAYLGIFMSKKSEETINQVGNIYMTSMNEEISMHFETTLSLRISQVEAMLETFPSGSEYNQEMAEDLIYVARARGFEHLAFCFDDGTFNMAFGEPIKLTDPQPFLESIFKGEKKIAVGTDINGNNLVLMGIPVNYIMPDGDETIAFIATLPTSYIQDTLSLDEENSMVYSHIIRKDGSFVIRSGGAYRDNYFDRIEALFEGVEGNDADEYVEELRKAMENNEKYSAVLKIGGKERRHLYCSKLAYSEWYLVTVMPYGTIDEVVSDLGNKWVSMVFLGAGIVLVVLLWIFFTYFRLTQEQIRDIDKARQEAIVASKAKGEFLSNMSHDIRTPMNAIVGMTAIAMANIDNNQQVQNCLKKITLSSKHLLGLINDVLDMSKIESGKMTLNTDQVSLREVMDSIVSIVQPQVKAKQQLFNVFIYDISTENVCCDSVRLNQVLLNLLSNAIKFTPNGGTIQVSLHEQDSPKGDNFIRIFLQVKDNGIGMSEEFRQKIFSSFTREDNARVNKTEGTGLGMAITKYIVDAMGGTIDVKSKKGEGSEFNVVLDLEKTTIKEEEMILPDWNMLVVDDDRQLCESTVESLKSIGISAEWALSGEDAIEMAQSRHNRYDDYHIILLDWKLPDMDGIDTAKELRSRMGNDIPIILISAYDWSDIEKEAREAGINGFISKPLFKSTLFYGLKQYAENNDIVKEDKEEANDDFLKGKRILLSEDNDLNWEIAEELLSDLGLDIERAENGQICVDKFNSSPVGGYDLILMDIRMPIMSGYEATEAIRALDRPDNDIPIIAMTADAFSEDIKRCIDCGMNAHVAKPIDIREVSRILKKYLN